MPTFSLFNNSETLEDRNARLAADHEKKKSEIMKYRGYTSEQAEAHLKMKKDGGKADKGLRALGAAFATEK